MSRTIGVQGGGESSELVVQRSSNETYTDMGAVCSADGLYRYSLWREWDDSKPTIGWIMANPSVGDGFRDDQTLRLVRGFSARWGFGRFVVGNLFGFVSQEPARLEEVDDPVGSENDAFLRGIVEESASVVVAWGDVGDRFGRPVEAVEMLDVELYALCVLRSGNPGHPIGKQTATTPSPFRIRE
ncbi:DUF1643 domain-containing protein [Haloferax namakaokahaiae]|uniref:DUF1643 domain-containing protein n=1 Tax=Haloferax namakaokahaiae TaxID=1748331 RepID=A0ABD5ZF33_9EURY